MFEELILLAESVHRYDNVARLIQILLEIDKIKIKSNPMFSKLLRKVFSKCLYEFSESDTFTRICSREINETIALNSILSQTILPIEKSAPHIYQCLRLGIHDGSLTLTQNGYRIASTLLIGNLSDVTIFRTVFNVMLFFFEH
jgi:hypothetical protein